MTRNISPFDGSALSRKLSKMLAQHGILNITVFADPRSMCVTATTAAFKPTPPNTDLKRSQRLPVVLVVLGIIKSSSGNDTALIPKVVTDQWTPRVAKYFASKLCKLAVSADNSINTAGPVIGPAVIDESEISGGGLGFGRCLPGRCL